MTASLNCHHRVCLYRDGAMLRYRLIWIIRDAV